MKAVAEHSQSQWEFSIALARRLRQLRLENGYTQERLAYSCGTALYTIQRLEKGTTAKGEPLDPRCFTLLKIAELYEMSLSELLEGV